MYPEEIRLTNHPETLNHKPVSPHRIKNIQALRGVAVLLIVFFHLATIEQKFGGALTILPNFFQFGMFGVDLFFVISGFVMVTVSKGKFQQTRQAVIFLYHRVSRIYPLYGIYSLLVLAVFLYQPSLINNTQGNQVNIGASFFLLPQQHLPLLMVGWTLVHEMYFYLIFFLFLFLPEKFLLAGLGLWTIGILLLQQPAAADSSPALHLISHPLTMEFVGGCLLAVFTSRAKKTPAALFSLSAALLIFITAVICFMLQWQTTGLIEPPGWQRVLLLGIPALLIVYFLIKAEQRHFILPGPLCRIGDISYSIYLSHVLTLNLLGRIWAGFATDATLDNLIVLPIMLLSVIAVGYISYIQIERPMIAISRRIA